MSIGQLYAFLENWRVSGKEPICQCKRHKRCGFDPWVRRIPGGGYGNPLQYSCLENPMDRRVWWATIRGITKTQTRLPLYNHFIHIHTHTNTKLIMVLSIGNAQMPLKLGLCCVLGPSVRSDSLQLHGL